MLTKIDSNLVKKTLIRTGNDTEIADRKHGQIQYLLFFLSFLLFFFVSLTDWLIDSFFFKSSPYSSGTTSRTAKWVTWIWKASGWQMKLTREWTDNPYISFLPHRKDES